MRIKEEEKRKRREMGGKRKDGGRMSTRTYLLISPDCVLIVLCGLIEMWSVSCGVFVCLMVHLCGLWCVCLRCYC